MEDAEYTCGVCDGTCAYCESTEDLMTEGNANGLLCRRCWSNEVPKWKDKDLKRRQWYRTLAKPTMAKHRAFVTTYVGKLDGVVIKELSHDGRLKLALRVYCKRGRERLAGNSNVGRQKTKVTRTEDEEVFRGIARTCLREISSSRGAERFSFDLLTEAENKGRRMESNDLEGIFLRRYRDVQRLTGNEEKVTELRVLDISRRLAVAIASETRGVVIINKGRARLPSYSEEPERFVGRVIEISRAWLDHCESYRTSHAEKRASGAKKLKRQEAELREKREAASKKPKRAPPRQRGPYVAPPVPVSRPNYFDPSTEVTVAGFGDMSKAELDAAVRARGGRLRRELGRQPNADECKKWLREYIERDTS